MAVPALALAADTPPHCDAKHLGQFWPAPKSGDATSLQQLSQSGELKVCSRSDDWRWRYSWQRLTITVEQLKAESKRSAPATTHQ